MKRRIIALSLAMVMLLGIFTACDKKKANGRKDSQEAAMEAKETQKPDQSVPTDSDTRIIEAEQTEIAVWESLLEIRFA